VDFADFGARTAEIRVVVEKIWQKEVPRIYL
jgi:hypothetical protein